jgi:hypothetical protein
VVDSRVQGLQLVVVSPVQAGELLPLVVGARYEDVCGVDDPRLAVDPDVRLGAVPGRQEPVLDLAERVVGVDQGHPPPGRQRRPGEARLPVVRVHHVVAKPLRQRRRADPRHEVAEVSREGLLRKSLAGAGLDGDHPNARPERRHRPPGAVGPGVDVGLDPPAGEGRCEVADVDGHPAGFAGAGGPERRRVVRKDGYTADHVTRPYSGAERMTRTLFSGTAWEPSWYL